MALRASGLAIALGTQLAFARILGGTQYGYFAYALAWLHVLGSLGSFGMQQASARFLSAYGVSRSWPLLRGFLRFRAAVVLLVSVVLAGGLAVGSTNLTIWVVQQRQVLLTAAVFIPILALHHAWQGTLRGLHRQVAAEAIDQLLRPTLVICLAVALFTATGELTALKAVALWGTATTCACVVEWIVCRRSMAPDIFAARPAFSNRSWLATGASLLLIGGMQLILNRLDVIMLGAIVNANAAGIYTVVARFAELAAFALATTNVVIGPRISELYALDDYAGMQRMLRGSSSFVAVATLALALIFFLSGGRALSMFGDGFRVGESALWVLIVGQLLNGLCGPVGYLLVMTGNERVVAATQAVAAVLNVILNTLLIPRLGMLGAAIATASTMIVWNVALLMSVARRLNLNPTVLSVFRRGL